MDRTATKAGLLIVCILPLLVAGFLALRLWFDPATTSSDWHEPIWPVAILSVFSIFVFVAHVLGNKALQPGESDYWITRFIVMNFVGMLEYWRQHVANSAQV